MMKKSSKLFVILFCILALGLPGCGDSDDETSNAILAFAWATGILDLDFDTDGILITDINGGGGNDRAQAVAIQSDGKIVVGGSFDNSGGGTGRDFALARFNTDGSLDATFGTGGIVKTDISGFNDIITGLVIQPDGMIVVGGRSDNGADYDFAAARYDTFGVLDTGFDTDGIVTTDIMGTGRNDRGAAIALQADGMIVVAGQTRPGTNFNFALVRYTTLGVLDTGFDTDGIRVTNVAGGPRDDYAYALDIQSDGKIVVAGAANSTTSTNFAVVRYNTDGSNDTTFDIDGIVFTDVNSGSADIANAVTIQPDGKILAAGYTFGSFAITRYNPDGSLDPTFEYNGIVSVDFFPFSQDYGQSIALQSDGRIVVAGYALDGDFEFGIVRLMPDGMLDAGFGTGGLVVTDISAGGEDFANAVAIGPDGKIVVVGYSDTGGAEDFAIAVYE